MTGDTHAPGTSSSQPLPPAYTQAAVQPDPAAEERFQPPYFPGATAAAVPEPWTEAPVVPAAPEPWTETPGVAAAPEPWTEAPVVEEGDGIEELPAPEEYGYQDEPEDEAAAVGEIPEDAFYTPEVAEREPVYDAAAYDLPLPGASATEPAGAAPPASVASVEVAERLEAFARGLRERGSAAAAAGFSGDALDAALAGLISGYLAARGG